MTISIRFGTKDIRDLSDGAKVIRCRRLYSWKTDQGKAGHVESCGHRHKGMAAAMKCARSLAFGWLGRVPFSGKSWVEIIGVATEQPASPSTRRSSRRSPPRH